MRSLITLGLPVISGEYGHLKKLGHISGGLRHSVVIRLQMPDLIVCPNSIGLNLSHEVQHVLVQSDSLKSVHLCRFHW